MKFYEYYGAAEFFRIFTFYLILINPEPSLFLKCQIRIFMDKP